jgi:hypothetical protein
LHSQVACKRCPAGQYSAHAAAIECDLCPTGSYCNQADKPPKPCPAGCFCLEGQTQGTTCPTGYQTSLTAQSYCRICEPGTYIIYNKNINITSIFLIQGIIVRILRVILFNAHQVLQMINMVVLNVICVLMELTQMLLVWLIVLLARPAMFALIIVQHRSPVRRTKLEDKQFVQLNKIIFNE